VRTDVHRPGGKVNADAADSLLAIGSHGTPFVENNCMVTTGLTILQGCTRPYRDDGKAPAGVARRQRPICLHRARNGTFYLSALHNECRMRTKLAEPTSPAGLHAIDVFEQVADYEQRRA
jgi:hypothetical protein